MSNKLKKGINLTEDWKKLFGDEVFTAPNLQS